MLINLSTKYLPIYLPICYNKDMKKVDIKQLVNDLCQRKNEEVWFEFKENWYEPHEIGEYISALSNSAAIAGKDEGYLVWGIRNKGHKIVGTKVNYNKDVKDEPLQNYLAHKLMPSIAFKFDEKKINNKRVVVLRIPAAKRVPTAFERVRYSRIGSSKVSLDKYPEREAMLWDVLSKGYPTMINTESPIQDLKFDQLKAYYLSKNLQFNNKFKNNLKLLTSDNKYNMLACFLADNGNIPVRVSIFNGGTKASTMFSVKEFGKGSLVSVIDKIIDFSSSINIIKSIENFKTGVREDINLFEQDCFNEALKNAFIHNNWLHRVSPMVTFYDDRVEIVSFSKLAPNQTIDGFFNGYSIPVNEDLSTIFLTTHLSERVGKGVPLIVSKYGKKAFDITEEGIKVTLPYNWKREFSKNNIEKVLTIDKKSRKLVDKLVNKLVDKINDNERIILEYIIIHPRDSQLTIAKNLNLGKTTIQNAIVKFKKFKLIKRVGSNKTGHWEVKK